ncbi:sterol 14 desaturase [Scenedesmus sp. NREL 46B-D3]|nr:sterol 14 desaturase [Scenedesmus sp. NREL 46B-D3]
MEQPLLTMTGAAGSFSPFQLAGLLGVFGILSMFVMRVFSSQFPGSKPPVFEGAPFVGGLIKFAGGPWKLMEEGYAKLGDAFTVPVAHKRVTFLIGPDVAPHFFKATDEELSQTEVYNFNVPTFGKGVVYDVDQKTRTEQFRFFTEALKKDRLAKYVPQFVAEAESYFSRWGESGVVDLKDEFSRLVALTAARTLLGREIREQLFDEVADLLHDLDDGMRPISVFFPYLPTSYHKKRDQARVKLGRIFAKVIQARRASGTKEEDVLQQFCDARYQNVCGGRQLTEDEITGLLIAVLFAGQHTSSITSAWTGYEMVSSKTRGPQSPYHAAVAEQQAVVKKHGGSINFDVLGEMEALHLNIQEALRMHPPLLLVMRYVKQPFSVTTSQGRTYNIPVGDILAASPNFAHMLPTVFKDPEVFEPARFLPPREEDRAKPFSYVGFGGGRHACIGQNFAYLQIKSIWSVMLRNFDFEMLGPVPAPDYDSMVIGPKPARIRYTRRKLAA